MTFVVEPDSGWADERSTHEGITARSKRSAR